MKLNENLAWIRGSNAVRQVRIKQYVRINVLRLFYIKKLYPFTLASHASDIAGLNIDSAPGISIMCMHKVKIRIGDEIRIWMIDSGASDLLISDKFATELKAKRLFSELDFIGKGQYVLADSRLITCKRYKIDGLQIGNLKVNNVILSVSKEVLNKFSSWSLDNQNNLLILKK